MHVPVDGKDALYFIHKRGNYRNVVTSDIILLDLNLPKIDGREVLNELNNVPILHRIPVIVFSSSKVEKDILESCDKSANCYIVKLIELEKFINIVDMIKRF